MHSTSFASSLAAVAACLALAGCNPDSRIPSEATASPSATTPLASAALPADLEQALAALRKQTASWHNRTLAEAAGYTVDVGCSDERTEGLSAAEARGMGYHTLNPALLDDRTTLLQPELIVYALDPASGKLQYAGFDYFIPGTLYPSPASSGYPGQPPILEGIGTPLTWNDAHAGWIAHIWPWMHNPDGMFENFNRNVPLCECQISPDRSISARRNPADRRRPARGGSPLILRRRHGCQPCPEASRSPRSVR